MAEADKLDEKGRCCGIKPIVYRGPNPYLFCSRCDRAFSPDGQQIENWAWLLQDGKFVRRRADFQ